MIGVALMALFVGFSGAVVPGPLFALTLNQALVGGWTAGFWLILGHALAELVVVIGLRVGLGGVLQRPTVTRAISLVGGAVLLFFAWDMLGFAIATGVAHSAAEGDAAMSALMLMGQGALLSLVNPYWHLWWATVGVGLIASQSAQHGPMAWPVFYIGHISADVIWYGMVSILIGVGGAFFSQSLHRGLIGVCGLGIAILGVLFILRPLREWMRARTNAPVRTGV